MCPINQIIDIVSISKKKILSTFWFEVVQHCCWTTSNLFMYIYTKHGE
jgi:hypothetical protein